VAPSSRLSMSSLLTVISLLSGGTAVSCQKTVYTKILRPRFWGRLKVGRLYGRKFQTRRQAMDEVIDWMTFYNHRRIHSTLGYVSPMQFEKSWHAAQLKKAA
jgi:hypothetical protein